jgi:hypothetical protein
MGTRSHAIGEVFHICPICLAQARLLRRTLVLPHLTSCPTHQVALHSRCVCGTPLFLDLQGHQPFVCFLCGLDWGRLPLIATAPEVAARERELWALYAFFLSKGTYELKHSALSLLRSSLLAHPSLLWTHIDGGLFFRATQRQDLLPLGDLVDLLVTFGISPDDIERNALTDPA